MHPVGKIKVTVTKRFTFEASHQLPWHKGKCKDLHGHSYKLEVEVSREGLAPTNEHSIVYDFSDLSDIVKLNIIFYVDHKHLNDLMNNPTAECIANWIWITLYSCLVREKLNLESITLWETETSRVTIRT